MIKIDPVYRAVDIQKIALDGAWQRNEAIANNMANVNTPGYKRQDVEFESILQSFLDKGHTALATTNDRHFNVNGQLATDQTGRFSQATATSFRQDNNNVDLDTEMAEMTKNSLYYNAVTNQVSGHFRRLKMAVKEGR